MGKAKHMAEHLFFLNYIYTGCNRRKGPDFGRVFMLNYTEKPQNTYIQS